VNCVQLFGQGGGPTGDISGTKAHHQIAGFSTGGDFSRQMRRRFQCGRPFVAMVPQAINQT
jgi:hypothetical protein